MFKGASSPPFWCQRFWSSTLFMRDTPFWRSSRIFFLILGSVRGGALPEMRAETWCWFGWNGFVHFCVFASHDFFLSCQVVHRHLFRVTQLVSGSSSILRVWWGTEKIVAGCGCDTFQYLSVRFVMFCVNIVSDGVQCVLVCCVLFSHVFVHGFGHCCASKSALMLTVCLLRFLLGLIGLVLAPMLVTTLVSRRCSVLRVWSQRKTHCCGKPRTWSIKRCRPPPLLHPALLPPLHQKKTRVCDGLRKRHSVFLDPSV